MTVLAVTSLCDAYQEPAVWGGEGNFFCFFSGEESVSSYWAVPGMALGR